jgi:YD repeat-containing protein
MFIWGGNRLFAANYNGIHLPLQITGADGQTTNIAYNLVGQIASITNPLSQTNTFSCGTLPGEAPSPLRCCHVWCLASAMLHPIPRSPLR